MYESFKDASKHSQIDLIHLISKYQTKIALM